MANLILRSCGVCNTIKALKHAHAAPRFCALKLVFSKLVIIFVGPFAGFVRSMVRCSVSPSKVRFVLLSDLKHVPGISVKTFLE